MNRFFINIFIAFFLLAIFGKCTGIRDRAIENEGVILIKNGEKRFQIDSLTTNIPQDIQVFENVSEDILAILNPSMNEIQLFNFNSEVLIEKRKLDENFFGQISDFYIHNLDSVFISSISKNSVWLIDSKNQIKQSYKLTDAIGSSLPIGNENIVFSHGKLIVSTQVGIFNSEGIENSPLVFVFDLINDSTYEYLTYPKVYKESFSPELGLYYNAFNYSNGRFYHGFSVSNGVYFFDLENNKFDSINITPNFDFLIRNSTQKDLDNVNSRQRYYFSNYNFGYLLVNSSKNYLLRSFYLPTNDINKLESIKFDQLKPKMIIISDLNSGEFKGQFLLTDKQNDGLMFSLGDKLYINKNQDNEDQIVFEVFDFSN